MAETESSKRETGAKSQDKDFVARLADAGEDALQRLAELPGGQRFLGALNELRSRVDELGKKVRGIDALEERVAKLEKDVAALKRTSKTPRRTGSTTRKSA